LDEFLAFSVEKVMADKNQQSNYLQPQQDWSFVKTKEEQVVYW